MEIKSLKVECCKSKKIPSFDFSSQKYGISIEYQNVPDEFTPADVEEHCTSIHSFLAEIIDHRLGLVYTKPKPENCQPVVIGSVNEPTVKEVLVEKDLQDESSDNSVVEKPTLCTYKQVNCIIAKCKSGKVSKEQLLDKIAVCYNIGSLDQLTIIEASEIISLLSKTNSIDEL